MEPKGLRSPRDIAESHTILRGLVGSTVHGTSVEGTDDRDEMGVCIEPPEYVIANALTDEGEPFEQWVYRDAVERAKARGEVYGRGNEPRSEPGDLDLKIYGLKKFCGLALKGNPSVLTLLYVPSHQISATYFGHALRELAPAFASKRVVTAFAEYQRSQRHRLLGDGRTGGRGRQRPELVERYGYDTKFAGHMLRLGLQGIEFATTGKLTLPMPRFDREFIIGVRTGRFSLEKVVQLSKTYESELERLRSTSTLPSEPDREAVDRFLVQAYTSTWGYVAHDKVAIA